MATDENEGCLRSLYEIFAVHAEDTAAEPRPSAEEALQLARLFYDQHAEARAGLMRLARLYVTLDHAARGELNATARKLASRAP